MGGGSRGEMRREGRGRGGGRSLTCSHSAHTVIILYLHLVAWYYLIHLCV